MNTEPNPLLQSFEKLQQDDSRLHQECHHLLDENTRLKQEIRDNEFKYTNLKSSQIRAYTRLPSMGAFLWVLSLVSVFYKQLDGYLLETSYFLY
ncbi:hypothetical protein DPMN_013425 [Dreissena polymorpha]|uniref:Uncharacterized protein n=1 Tax=Dreissena polymorpha TaxID=45954 RepID=A0A9D4N7D8_DREPO|nr:hypothetical protein DPMN_013425 [Dreissena polymorpha]